MTETLVRRSGLLVPIPLRNSLGDTIDTVADPRDGSLRAVAPNGRLVVAPGTTIASAWGNTTFDQTMQTYASAADRTNQWPTPNEGALSFLVDSHTPFIFRSGAWHPLPIGFVAGVVGPAAQIDCGSAGATVVSLAPILTAGRRYRVHAYATGGQQTATGSNIASLNGVDLGAPRLWTNTNDIAGNARSAALSVQYTAAATGAHTFSVVILATAGVFRVTANTCELSVDDIGG
jgi:hypothetical protein